MQASSDVIRIGGGSTSLMCLLFIVCSGMADDWPQWRGPNRNGAWKEKDLSFPPEGVPVLWTVPAGGGFSSPIVSRWPCYAFDSVLQNPRAWERLRCFDLNSGHLLWSQSNAVTYPDYGFDSNNTAGPNATSIVGCRKDLFYRSKR